MFKIDKASGQVIASDTQSSIQALDNAVISLAHLCASIVEVSNASRLPVALPQSALADAGEGLAKIIASRADMARATKRLIAIQRLSDLQTTSYGCPDGTWGHDAQPVVAEVEKAA